MKCEAIKNTMKMMKKLQDFVSYQMSLNPN